MVRLCGVPIAFICLAIFTSTLRAQTQRYELGRRLRTFESAWEKTPGEETRKRTVTSLNQAVTAFFTFRFGEAARAVDLARFALDDAVKPTAARLWAESLAIYPAFRLVDVETQEIALEVSTFYEVPRPADTEFTLRLSLSVNGKETSAQSLPIKTVPAKHKISVKDTPEGDHWLHYEIWQAKNKLAHGSQQISFVSKLADRIAALKRVDKTVGEVATELATLRATLRLADKLAAGGTEETDLPLARLLRETEIMGESIKARQPYFKKELSGEHWLSLAFQKNPAAAERVFPMRVLVPAKWDDKNPPPLVIALHGAGGSENMFFDGYGAGKIVGLCRERGWMLAAPRVGFNLSGSLADVLDELHKRWPFDSKCVFIVGHSMGAAQAIQAASNEPGRYAGVVALGGSGTYKATDDLRKIPFFIGVGQQDFALSGARGLRDRLLKDKVKKVTYRELENVEHLGIVQQSLAEAFSFCEKIVESRRTK